MFKIAIIFAFLSWSTCWAETSESPEELSASGNTVKGAAVIPVEGVFKPLLVTTVKRRTEQAIKDGAEVLIYRVKSDGGQLGAAMELSNYVFSLSDNLTTLAYVDDKAYSAAALFSLACDDLIMEPGSAIGDCEPIMPTQGGYTTAGEKIQSPLKERFRSYASKNGYPKLLAQAMVTSQLKILEATNSDNQHVFYRSEDWEMIPEEKKERYSNVHIICHEGDLLTLSDREALELGFSEGTFEDVNDYLKQAGLTSVETVFELNSTEELVNTLDDLTPLLLALGLFFLYMEIKTPGVGLFGSLGAVTFAVFFMGKFYQGQAGYLELMLFALGFALMALEVFVFPGFGLAGLAGMLMLVSGLVLAMQDFNVPTNTMQWNMVIDNLAVISLSFLMATGGFIFLMMVLPKGKSEYGFWHGFFQHHQQQATPAETFNQSENHPIENNLVGKRGVATTVLMPGGKADIEGQSWSVCSESGAIEKGTAIEVISQEGQQLLVKTFTESTQGLDI